MWRSLVGQGLCLALLVACGEEDPAADDDSSDVSDDTGGAVAFEGDEPALKTGKRPAAQCRAIPSAIWLRAELATHMNKIPLFSLN